MRKRELPLHMQVVRSDNLRLRCGHDGRLRPALMVRWGYERKGANRGWIEVFLVVCARCEATWAWSKP